MQKKSIVKLEAVNKNYQLGQTSISALKSVNLEIHGGEFTAVVGASGSGKSTLLNIIGCIDVPDSGVVLIDGVDISKMSDNQQSDLRNQKIGYIFQSFNLVPVLSVYENVELPLLINHEVSEQERARRVKEAILEVGLEPFSKNRPDQLSGGQRQRVAIARALAGHPLLVLADEPTANLDSENSGKIIELMLSLNKNKNVTFLFSTHDEKLVSRVSRVVHIKDGAVQT
ncbi:MAG: ABC transporter ATP-binding protein [Bdellovibrio sp.]|nr:ABC transporter ATP-binding protein [Bdellovibrio sp.]